jgi:hypothetical protein
MQAAIVAKKTEWHSHQRLECMIQPLHQALMEVNGGS